MKLDLKTDLHDESITRQGLGLSRHLANQTVQPFRCDDPGFGGEHTGRSDRWRREASSAAIKSDQPHEWISEPTSLSSIRYTGPAKAGQLDRAVSLGETTAVGPDG